ncbi:HAD family hydrolase [Nocardioides sp. YIM 152588]|uniref:HAD family hydrolase n=1 Tax=Nocardioides sp. YIM 152588 TaxID=3158259 RepID=UPI0032E47DC3
MTATSAPDLTVRPEALLLDFGGVVFETRKRPEAMAEFAAHVAQVLARAGHAVDPEALVPVLQGGKKALSDWKNAASRRPHPRELTHREIWRDFYASPLPPAEREVLVGEAGELQEWITLAVSEHVVRPGIRELLALAAEIDIPVGIVSNAHGGRAHRRLMERHGLAEHFGVQVYSDEVGIRKPNPDIIELAAAALGTTAARSWYVGDTFDRDVACARRAGAAAVILTRHHSTDRVPFAIADVPDREFATPEGLVPLLRATRPGAFAPPAAPAPVEDSKLPSALLLDHGGVISTSTQDPAGRRGFAHDLAAGLRRAGWHLSDADAEAVVRETVAAHKQWKKDRRLDAEDGAVPEIDPTTYWVGLAAPLVEARVVGDHAGVRAWLRAEAHALSVAWGRIKSVSTLRPGVRELCVAARSAGVPIAIVSNTVSGRSVREKLAAHGLDHLVGASVYSDELGRRKPDALVALTACRALGVDPARAVLVGDKPANDVVSARGAGVGTAVIVRGGSLADAELDAILADPDSPQRPDLVVEEMGELIDALHLRP